MPLGFIPGDRYLHARAKVNYHWHKARWHALNALGVTPRDAHANLVTSNTSTVTIAVKSGPGGFTSGSTLTAKAVNGVAKFSSVKLAKAGKYTLKAVAGSLASATSGDIVVS